MERSKKLREELGLKELENEIPLSHFKDMEEPVLTTTTTSVSDKLYLAAQMQRFDTIGTDVTASAVNDLLAMRAKPLMISDTISCAKARPGKIKEMEAGIEQACMKSGIRYAGSEIKELPDIFSYDQYDLVGFSVGICEFREKMQSFHFRDGDVIIGLTSNGLHNSGYVTARKKLYLSKASMEVYYETLGATLGDLLLQPTKLYKRPLEAAFESGIEIKSCVQVSDGGFDAAVRRLLYNRAGAVIKQKKEQMQPLYEMLHKDGNISREQMRCTFNMGVGMLLLVAEENADAMIELLENEGETPQPLGLIERDSYTIRYIKS